MYNIRRVKVEDMVSLLKEDMNLLEGIHFDDDTVRDIEGDPFAVSIFYKGELMLCGGARPYWHNRCQIWTLFSKKAGENFLPCFRAIKQFLEYVPYKRIELSVPYGFKKGVRRALMLGFQVECERARNFLPDGQDCTLLSLVKDC